MSRIRLATSADSSRLAEIFAPYVSDTVITFSETAPSAEDFAAKIEGILPELPFLVYEEGGKVLAYAYAAKHRQLPAYRWCAEVSIYADLGARAKGAGSRLYTALLALLERQGYVNLYAGITLPNPSSVGIHEKFGFRPFAEFRDIGFKRGAWHHVGWWEKKLEANLRNPPGEPVAFGTLRETESAWVSDILGA